MDRRGGLDDDEQTVVDAVARWVDREVRPHAGRLERAGEYPAALIDQMKEMGVFGLAVPTRWSESAVSARCFALVTAELARGWMSLAGAMGGHSVVPPCSRASVPRRSRSAGCRGWRRGRCGRRWR